MYHLLITFPPPSHAAEQQRATNTGGGAARSGKKRNPDVADPEEASQAELVGTVGAMESVERKIDLLVTTISALTNSVNKLVGGIEAKEEKVTEQSKKSSVDLNGKKRRNDVKRHEEFIPDIGEIVKLAYSNSFKDKTPTRFKHTMCIRSSSTRTQSIMMMQQDHYFILSY